ISTRAEVGWKYDFGRYAVTPFAALQFAELWQHAYTEQTHLQAGGQPGILGTYFGQRTTTSLPLFLGAQIESRMTFGDAVWSPYLRAAWVHEFEPNRTIVPTFISAPGVPFVIEGARAMVDAAKVDAGAKLLLSSTVSVFGNLTGEFSPRGNSVIGSGGLKFGW